MAGVAITLAGAGVVGGWLVEALLRSTGMTVCSEAGLIAAGLLGAFDETREGRDMGVFFIFGGKLRRLLGEGGEGGAVGPYCVAGAGAAALVFRVFSAAMPLVASYPSGAAAAGVGAGAMAVWRWRGGGGGTCTTGSGATVPRAQYMERL